MTGISSRGLRRDYEEGSIGEGRTGAPEPVGSRTRRTSVRLVCRVKERSRPNTNCGTDCVTPTSHLDTLYLSEGMSTCLSTCPSTYLKATGISSSLRLKDSVAGS